MRITGGIYKGLRIPDRRGAVRPMMAQMRESLFTVLALRGALAGGVVVDLFAGTGALAVEALSRGAAAATLCDISRAAVQHVRRALPPPIYAEKQIIIRCQRAERFIRQSAAPAAVIFLDPPYSYAHYPALLAAVRSSALTAVDSVVVLHYRYATPIASASVGLCSVWQRRFGGSMIELFYPRAQ